MKNTNARFSFIYIAILVILTACNLPSVAESVATDQIKDAETVKTTDESEEEPELVEVNLEELLDVGNAMKWYDEGYLVFVPDGEVVLGYNNYEDNPEHKVYLDDFWIYMFKVTNGQYNQCVLSSTCSPLTSKPPYPEIANPEVKDYPVVGVTWEQANTYCKWMNASLPTEAQWEKAARGPESNTYPWGESAPNCDLLNFNECEYAATTKVFAHPGGQSFYEAYDLAGNIFEWTRDWYQIDYVNQAPDMNPTGPVSGTERSVRGSSFNSIVNEISSSQRSYLHPEQYRPDLGFRCVVEEIKPFAPYCVQAAFIPGSPVPWQVGPPPGETPLDPEFGPGECVDWGAGFGDTLYCAYPQTQQGGLNLETINSATIKSWNSDEGVICVEGDPFACLGPDNAKVTITWCTTCTPDPIHVSKAYDCAPGYNLNFLDPPECDYPGKQPTAEEISQWEICPNGFTYDAKKDLCVKVVPNSQDCPQGYTFDTGSQCCEAKFTDINPELGEILPYSYLTCPIGAASSWPDIQFGEMKCVFEVIFPEIEECYDNVIQVGDCPDPPDKPDEKICKNPNQYPSQGPCEAAGCVWFKDSATGGQRCIAP